MPLVDVCSARFQYTNIHFLTIFYEQHTKRKKMNGKCFRCMMRCEGGAWLCLNSGGDDFETEKLTYAEEQRNIRYPKIEAKNILEKFARGRKSFYCFLFLLRVMPFLFFWGQIKLTTIQHSGSFRDIFELQSKKRRKSLFFAPFLFPLLCRLDCGAIHELI